MIQKCVNDLKITLITKILCDKTARLENGLY